MLLSPILLICVFIIFCGLNLFAQKITFRPVKRTLDIGETTKLTWHIKGISRKSVVKISGIDSVFGRKGEVEVSPEVDTRYTLIYKGRMGESKKYTRIKVRKPEIIFFKGSDSVNNGNLFELSWKTRFASKIEIEDLDAYLPATGSRILSVDAPKEYTLKVCNNFGYCVTAKVKADFNGDFVKGPSNLKLGESGMIEWKFQDAYKVEIENFAKDLASEGSRKIAPGSTTEYKFIVHKKQSDGTDTVVTKSLKVPVVRSNYIKGVKSFITLPEGRRLMFDIFSVNWQNFPDEIRLKVMITDTAGNYISGLAPPFITDTECKKYFKSIIETVEDKRYPINDFIVTEIKNMTSTPHDIALVLDYSGSMYQSFEKLDKVTQNFVKRKHYEDRMGIVRFDDSIGVESPLVKDARVLLNTISYNKGNDYGGSTALYAAADAGMKLFDDPLRSKQLLLMTDGYENSSMFYWGTYYTFASEVIAEARKNFVTINTIDYMGYANTPLLEALADMSGGKYYQLQREKDIEDVFNELQHLYHNYYEIIYKPATAKGNRIVELVYDDGSNNLATAIAKAFIDEDSTKIEIIENEGIVASSSSVNKQTVLSRQTVALFEFNKYEIDEDSQKKLERIVAYMKNNSHYKIVIRGHSDLKGNDIYCKRISDARAQAVSLYLRKNGISSARILWQGKGKAEPVWSNEDQEWKARENRRVDIEFVKK